MGLGDPVAFADSPFEFDHFDLSALTARIMKFVPNCGAVAQLGERLVRNEEASGSIPLSSTKFLSKFQGFQAA